jgi:putative flippase GtrA
MLLIDRIKNFLIVSRFIRFSIIGTFGYLIDISIFFAINELYELSVYFSRIISFVFAATFSWYGNRLFTFASSKKKRVLKEWIDYLYSMTPGAAMNYLVFLIIVFSFENTQVVLFFAFSIGVLVGLLINYNLAKKYVFK